MNEWSPDGMFPPRKRVNIYDVAEYAKVSTKTVSKVVNHLPEVSQKTRARVLDAVASLGYKPNLQARHLASERPTMLALFCDEPAAGSGYIGRLQTGALSFCHQEGFHLVVECIPSGGDSTEHVKRLVAGSCLAGAILTPPLCDDQSLIDILEDAGAPVARISPSRSDLSCVNVDIDNFKAAHEMTNYLIGLGHRRIAIVRGASGHADAGQRYEGYVAALSDADLPVELNLQVQGNYTYKSGFDAGNRLLSLPRRPTAIFACNDDMAAGVVAVSLKFNLAVPQDLSVAGFDDGLFSRAVWPRLTTCRQPVAEMATVAAAALTSEAADQANKNCICLPHRIVVRGTTASPLRGSD